MDFRAILRSIGVLDVLLSSSLLSSGRVVFLCCSDQKRQEPQLEFLSVKLFDNFLFDRHFLEDGKTESLSDASICAIYIPRDNLNDLLQDCKVIRRLIISVFRWSYAHNSVAVNKQVVDTLHSACQNRDQGTHCMFKTGRIHLKQINQESAVPVLLDQKDIVSNEFSYQISAQFRRDLQSVDSQTQKHFNNVLNVAFALPSDYPVFMLL